MMSMQQIKLHCLRVLVLGDLIIQNQIVKRILRFALSSTTTLEGILLLHQPVHAGDHVHHQLVFRKSNPAPVADVNPVHHLRVLSGRATRLTVALTCLCVDLVKSPCCNQLWDQHVH